MDIFLLPQSEQRQLIFWTAIVL